MLRNRSWVYFIQAENGGPIKIGHSSVPSMRLDALQTGCPEPLRLRLEVPGTRADEADLHALFRDLRQHGEWFEPANTLPMFIGNLVMHPGLSLGGHIGEFHQWQAMRFRVGLTVHPSPDILALFKTPNPRIADANPDVPNPRAGVLRLHQAAPRRASGRGR